MTEDDAVSDASHTPVPSPAPQHPLATETSLASISHGSSEASQLTSSDKLTELPVPFAAASPRRRHHSFDEASSSHSAPEIRRLANTSSPAIEQKASTSDGSLGRVGKTGARVSFESDRTSLPSASAHPSPRAPPSERLFPPLRPFSPHASKDGADSPRSRSRASSPLRTVMERLPGLHRFRSREELWTAVDPFRFLHLSALLSPHRHPHLARDGQAINCRCTAIFHSPTFHDLHLFVFGVLPRSIYLHCLLRLPALYFSRVARIFEDAEVSRPDMQRMVDLCMSPSHSPSRARSPLPDPDDWEPPVVSPALARFKRHWESFVEQLLREWKTLNLVSALLLSAILTMFQIPSAANDALTRTAALLSLVAAIVSLSLGCVYIVRFGTMRSMYRAARWADEARRASPGVWWNAWVLLALPAVWLAWAMLAFLAAVLSFVWRTGALGDPDDDSTGRELDARRMLGPRVAITALLLLGLLYFVLVIRTFTRYSRGRPNGWREVDFTLRSAETGSERGRGLVRDDRSSVRTGRDVEAGRVNGGGDMSIGLGLGLRPPEKGSEDGRASNSASPYIS